MRNKRSDAAVKAIQHRLGSISPATVGEAVVDNIAKSGLTRFDVLIEDSDGNAITTFPAMVAQSRNEAINKAKQHLTFTAERSI